MFDVPADAPAAMVAPARVTFADLYADCGKPCCICLGPLRPSEADNTGLAHKECGRRELESLYRDDFESCWDDYARDVPPVPFPTPEQVEDNGEQVPF